MDRSEIDLRFTHHPPTSETVDAHIKVRQALHTAAVLVNELVPDGDELRHALGKIEAAMMWANAGIARRTERR